MQLTEEEILQMKSDLSTTKMQVSEVLNLLKPPVLDRDSKKKGMVGIVNDHEERLSHVENWKNKVTWFFYAGSAVAAFLTSWGLTDIIVKVWRELHK